MEGRQGWLTWGSSLWANVSCTGSCSPEMLLSPTVMPTTVLSKICAVWLASCGGETLQELSWWVASAGGSMKDAGNASPYLEHVKLLDIEDCHHHRHYFASQGPEYLPGEVDFTCLLLPCGVQPAGALWQRTVRGCCCWVTSLFRTHQSRSRHKFSPVQVDLLSNISRSHEGRREELHPQHTASIGAELGVGPADSLPTITHNPLRHPEPGESLWMGRRHKITHVSPPFLPHTPPDHLVCWDGSLGRALSSQAPLHVTPFQGMLKQPHKGGRRAQQGTPSPGEGAEGCLEGVGPSKQGRGRGTSHRCGGESNEDITGDSPADIQEQPLEPSQLSVLAPLQQPGGQEGCRTGGRGD